MMLMHIPMRKELFGSAPEPGWPLVDELFSPQGAPRVYQDHAAVDRLTHLGLNVADLHQALKAGDRHASTYTDLDPRTTLGVARWGRTNRALRELLLPRGWTPDDSENLPLTISPDNTIAIMATVGSHGAGQPHATPTNKHPKGTATQRMLGGGGQAVSSGGQLAFDLPDPASGRSRQTWILLYEVTDSHIRAELSLPTAINPQGFVSSWRERILLPPLNRDSSR